MANFKKLIPFIQKWEGGFSNHPQDRGGATQCGITLKTFRHFYGEEKTAEDLQRITQEQWAKIFKNGYWYPFGGDRINDQNIANICVDWAWASGTRTAVRQVQRIVGTKADGICGKKTIAAINAANPLELFFAIKKARIRFVDNIIKRNPSQAIFERGWKNRIEDLDYED